MKTKQIWRNVLLLLVATLSLASCSDDYKFLMYMDRYIVYHHQLNMPINPSDAYLERILTDEFKKALAEESAERIVERFGTHVLKKTDLGVNILSLYRSGLKANTRNADRFTAMQRAVKAYIHSHQLN